MENLILRFLFIIMFINLVSTVKGQDRQFVWTYQSTTLPRGDKDLEGWATYRTGRNYFFNALDGRLEFETGLTDKLQTSVYLNISQLSYGANEDTLGGIPDPSANGVFSETNFSVSNEWKLNLLNPSVDPVGLALYAEVLLGTAGYEIENKIILDKRWESDILSLNLVNEYEVEKTVENGETIREHANEPQIDLAYMHLIRPNIGLGFEIVNRNEIKEDGWNFSALSAGPTLFYTGKDYFFILNLQPQWMNLHKTGDVPTRLVLNDHEKLEIRLLWGFSL